MREALSALAILALADLFPQQSFRVSVDAVRVDVSVMDGNRVVGGLSATDFELRDSGVLQQIDSVSLEDVPVSIMLALDASSSVRGEPLTHLKQAASAVIALLKPDDRAALLTLSEEVDLLCEWTSDRDQLQRAIAGTQPSGRTALHDAAYAALSLRDPAGGRPLVLIFSDDEDTASWLPGTAVIDVAKRTEAVVYAVGLGQTGTQRVGYLVDFLSGMQPGVPRVVPSALSKSFIQALAEETGGKYIQAERSDHLRRAFVQVLTDFRSRYVLTYTPTDVDAAGWHPIDVRVKGRRADVFARRGYLR